MKNLNKDYKNIDFGLNQKIVEALIFSSAEPISYSELQKTITDDKQLDKILIALEKKYMSSGVNLYTISNSYAFRTSSEVSEYLKIERIVPKPLSRAATETLAIIAYHQPISRSEIENIRGVSLSRGTIDLLLELGWINLLEFIPKNIKDKLEIKSALASHFVASLELVKEGDISLRQDNFNDKILISFKNK